jgi:hypothetical protein
VAAAAAFGAGGALFGKPKLLACTEQEESSDGESNDGFMHYLTDELGQFCDSIVATDQARAWLLKSGCETVDDVAYFFEETGSVPEEIREMVTAARQYSKIDVGKALQVHVTKACGWVSYFDFARLGLALFCLT